MLSRFFILWRTSILLLLCLGNQPESKLCNALFIDPYLQDIRDTHNFEAKKVGLIEEYTVLEPSQSRLLHDPLMIQDGSNLVEVRVPPPKGFLYNGMPADLQGKHLLTKLILYQIGCKIWSQFTLISQKSS